ncbi:MAG: Tic22 family protein [Phormidesmis sp.]|mgnify:CR=1 FL=1
MTSFIRRALSSTLAIAAVSASLVGSVAVLPALALPQEQIAAKLTNVPAYVLSTEQGLLLLPTGQDANSDPGLYVFLSEQQAKGFVAKAAEANPEFAASIQVKLTSLEKLYKESQSRTEQPLRLMYIPEESEATQAAALNSDYRGGVPLFYAQFEDGSLASVEENGEPTFPMFFSRSDLDLILNELGDRNPEARAAISVGVLPLEFILAEMNTREEAMFNQIRLLPDSEVIQNINSGQR